MNEPHSSPSSDDASTKAGFSARPGAGATSGQSGDAVNSTAARGRDLGEAAWGHLGDIKAQCGGVGEVRADLRDVDDPLRPGVRR